MTREELEDQVIKLRRENVALKKTANKAIDEVYKIREALGVLNRRYERMKRYHSIAWKIDLAMLVFTIAVAVWAL